MQKESCVKNNEICLCPAEKVMNILSKKWTMIIISNIRNAKKLRFNELMKKLSLISPKTLSERLKELEKEGLLKREVFAEIPIRVEYSLTEKGFELGNAMLPLIEWTEK